MRVLSLCASALAFICLSSTASLAEDLLPATPACSDPKVAALNAEAATFDQRKQYNSAADSYRKADKQAKGQCSHTWFALYAVEIEMQNGEAANAAAQKLLPFATTDALKSQIYLLAANAALTPKPAEEKNPPSHDAATSAYGLAKAAVQSDKTNLGAYQVEGRAAVLLGKSGEAREIFAMMERAAPAGSAIAQRAHRLAENPDGAASPEMPSFVATTLAGTKLSKEDLAGKTVLIDFWATWCPACVEDTDYLKLVANRYKDRGLTVVSISVDSSEMKWKNYIEENRMRWAQVLDKDGNMRKTFNVGVFPTYLVIDENSNIRERIIGSREDLQTKLLKILPKPAAETKAKVE